MIDEEATFRKYGHQSSDTRCRRVIVICEGCGEPRDVSKYRADSLCRSCAYKGRQWSDERKKLWSKSRKGKNNPNYGNIGEKNPCFGRQPSPEELYKLSESHMGEKNHMYGKITPDDVKDKISKSLSGDNHPNYGKRGKDTTNWQGGLTPRMQAFRNTDAYKNWRESVYERDNWTCQECGARSAIGAAVYLNAHHIHPIKDNKNSLLLLDINNGITLCVECHNTTKGHEDDYIEHFERMISP